MSPAHCCCVAELLALLVFWLAVNPACQTMVPRAGSVSLLSQLQMCALGGEGTVQGVPRKARGLLWALKANLGHCPQGRKGMMCCSASLGAGTRWGESTPLVNQTFL